MSGRDRYLSETVRGIDRAARRKADEAMTRLQGEVDGRRGARTSVTLGYVLDEWLRTVELEDSTRETYVGYIERTIRPMLGIEPFPCAQRQEVGRVGGLILCRQLVVACRCESGPGSRQGAR